MKVRRLDPAFDMTFGHGMSDYLQTTPAIAQNVKTRLLLIYGEWFLDVLDGTPWFSVIGVKPMDIVAFETLVRQRILGTEGVVAIDSFALLFDPVTRKAKLTVRVRDIYGISTLLALTL